MLLRWNVFLFLLLKGGSIGVPMKSTTLPNKKLEENERDEEKNYLRGGPMKSMTPPNIKHEQNERNEENP